MKLQDFVKLIEKDTDKYYGSVIDADTNTIIYGYDIDKTYCKKDDRPEFKEFIDNYRLPWLDIWEAYEPYDVWYFSYYQDWLTITVRRRKDVK